MNCCKKGSYEAVLDPRKARVCDQTCTGHDSILVSRIAWATDPRQIKIIAENPF